MRTVPALCITLDKLEDSSGKFCSQKCFELAAQSPPITSMIYLVREDWKLAAINDNDVLEPWSTAVFLHARCAAYLRKMAPEHGEKSTVKA